MYCLFNKPMATNRGPDLHLPRQLCFASVKVLTYGCRDVSVTSCEERERKHRNVRINRKKKVWETGPLSTIYVGILKVNRHTYNLSFYTWQDDIRSMKTGQIHDTLPCRGAVVEQQGNIGSVLHHRFELQIIPPGRCKHCVRANG